jgi:addiction module HigA family antidote
MSNIKEYKDITAFHPGYYIADIIEEMEISQAEFATRMGTTAKTLSKVINGQANISNDLAKKLSVMTGTSVEVWQKLQNTYDRKLIEIQQTKDFGEQEAITKQIDYQYFVDVAGLPYVKAIKEKTANLCHFFKIADLRILLQSDFLVNYRTYLSSVSEKNIINSRAWVQTAINLSGVMETERFDSDRLKDFLPELRGMTVMQQKDFLPRMKEIFAESGVAFVVLPHLKNSGINGAVKWISEERVVLAIDDSGVDSGEFWFSLFHEIKHVMQQKIKTVFISSEDDITDINTKLEQDADRFANNYLISQSDMRRLSSTRFITDDEIVDFAASIGIHPGIVALRLLNDGVISRKRYAELKDKFFTLMCKKGIIEND